MHAGNIHEGIRSECFGSRRPQLKMRTEIGGKSQVCNEGVEQASFIKDRSRALVTRGRRK